MLPSLIEGKPVDWWEAETAKKFRERGRCLVEQYSKFYSPLINKTADGQRSLGENIADNGAVAEAYRAYSESTLYSLMIIVFFVFDLLS